MSGNKIIICPGAFYNEHVEQQNIFGVVNVYPPKDGERGGQTVSSVQLIDCSEDEDLEAEDVATSRRMLASRRMLMTSRMLLILRLLLMRMSEKQKRMRLLASAGRKPVGAERASISLPVMKTTASRTRRKPANRLSSSAHS